MGERIPYCGLCKDVFCTSRDDGGRNQIQNVSITPMNTPIEQCEIRLQEIQSEAEMRAEDEFMDKEAEDRLNDMDQWEDGSLYGF